MRIAIYSRKSKWTGRGDSVENQVSMCREYISRYVEGADQAEILIYEDEGFSGKNTRRPRFQDMMEDIRRRKYNYLVCYRLDRLGRSMIDLATLVEELNRRQVAFISIKEQFDTSTPMGRAMLYFAGVLAQMEREQIAERVRDNMVMLAKNGRWLGGNTPLGFISTEVKMVQLDGRTRKTWYLKENDPEILIVRLIFQQYLEKRSLVKVAEYLRIHQIRTRKGNDYTVTAVRDILRNPVYCSADREGYEYFRSLGCQVCLEEPAENVGKSSPGLICYAKTVSGHRENPPEKWILAAGKHRGIIAGKDFVKVQQLLENNKQKSGGYRTRNEIALLSGILYCSCGCAMRPKYYTVKQTEAAGNRRFSYICPRKNLTHSQNCRIPNLQGNTLDEQISMIVQTLLETITDWQEILKNTYSHLQETTRSSRTLSETDIRNQQIKEKTKQIENLIHTLSSTTHTPEFIRQIENEIRNLQEQINQLSRHEQTEDRETAQKLHQTLFSPHLTSLTETYPHFTVHQKRELIKNILDKIIWNGKELTMILKN